MYYKILSQFKKLGIINDFYSDYTQFLENINREKIVYYCENDDSCWEYIFIWIGTEINFPVFNIFYSNDTKEDIIKYKNDLTEEYKSIYNRLNIVEHEYNISECNLNKGIGEFQHNIKIDNYDLFKKKFITFYNLFSLYNSICYNRYISYYSYFNLVKNEIEIDNITSFVKFFNLIMIFQKLNDNFKIIDSEIEIKKTDVCCLKTNIKTRICIEDDETARYLMTEKDKNNLELLFLSFYLKLYESEFNVILLVYRFCIDEIKHNIKTGRLYNIGYNYSGEYDEINNKFNEYLNEIKEENSLAKMLLELK